MLLHKNYNNFAYKNNITIESGPSNVLKLEVFYPILIIKANPNHISTPAVPAPNIIVDFDGHWKPDLFFFSQ